MPAADWCWQQRDEGYLGPNCQASECITGTVICWHIHRRSFAHAAAAALPVLPPVDHLTVPSSISALLALS
jgi:hypothetical protein